jgi:hypothetical protein
VQALDRDQVRLLGRAGVAGEGWLRQWLPELADELVPRRCGW